MSWQKDLGKQIKAARDRLGMTQTALSKELNSRLINYTPAQISHIENGKSAPAVNIVTAIAEALNADFKVGGCSVGKTRSVEPGRPTIVPQQLSLQFGVDYDFSGASLRLMSLPEDAIALQATLRGAKPRPTRVIEAIKSEEKSA